VDDTGLQAGFLFFTQKQGPTESSVLWVPDVFPKNEAVGV
jgi:hypothetical protein